MSSYFLSIVILVLLLGFSGDLGKFLVKRRNGKKQIEFKEKYEIPFLKNMAILHQNLTNIL